MSVASSASALASRFDFEEWSHPGLWLVDRLTGARHYARDRQEAEAQALTILRREEDISWAQLAGYEIWVPDLYCDAVDVWGYDSAGRVVEVSGWLAPPLAQVGYAHDEQTVVAYVERWLAHHGRSLERVRDQLASNERRLEELASLVVHPRSRTRLSPLAERLLSV